jgi:hypothetical protein
VPSPTITIRLPDEQMAMLVEEVARRNEKGRVGRSITLTDYVRAAIQEKIAHRIRGRKCRKRPDRNAVDTDECPIPPWEGPDQVERADEPLIIKGVRS